jgi:ribose transport system ATP-binding protein
MSDTSNGANQDTVVALRQITKVYPGVVALDRVDLTVDKNEVVGLVGENGAGKSVLMKIMIGLEQPDEGTILLRGQQTTLRDPSNAIKNGIGMVFQDGSLVPNLSVTENLFLCHEADFRKVGILSLRVMRDAARELLRRMKLDINVDLPVTEISSAERQMVEIARLLWLSRQYGQENPVLILDEPTTVLADAERNRLFSILKDIKKQASVILISHRLQEIIENSDRIVVLKDGRNVTEIEASKAKLSRIEQLMVGHTFSADRFQEDEQVTPGEREILRVENLSKAGFFEPLSFTVREGEIVGLVGLVGSGKESVCNCIAGLDKADTGDVFLNARKLPGGSPSGAVKAGIGHIPIDRRSEGLALMMSVAENVNLLVLNRLKTAGFLSPVREKKNAQYWISECQIKTPSIGTLCANLSGGNQQKTVISKWLSSRVRLLILDHPTRGVDVGAKDEIYKLIRRLAKEGIGMLIMCDTLEEDIGLASRMLVMKDGRLMKEIDSSAQNKPAPKDIIGLIV